MLSTLVFSSVLVISTGVVTQLRMGMQLAIVTSKVKGVEVYTLAALLAKATSPETVIVWTP